MQLFNFTPSEETSFETRFDVKPKKVNPEFFNDIVDNRG
jgi:hypothetical protein